MLYFIEEREGREYEGMRTPLPLSPPLGSPLTYVLLTSRGGGISPGPVVTVGCLPPGGGVHPRGARLCVRGPPARAGRVRHPTPPAGPVAPGHLRRAPCSGAAPQPVRPGGRCRGRWAQGAPQPGPAWRVGLSWPQPGWSWGRAVGFCSFCPLRWPWHLYYCTFSALRYMTRPPWLSRVPVAGTHRWPCMMCPPVWRRACRHPAFMR